jgi:predicted DNA-binding transcriptional regulator YafY
LIDPYWIEEQHGIPYLRAYCHSAGAVLTFRLDRIEALVLSPESRVQSPKSAVQRGITQTLDCGLWTIWLVTYRPLRIPIKRPMIFRHKRRYACPNVT